MEASRSACGCTLDRHTPRFIAVTGGPGGGKTAVLEVVRRHFCEHVVVLPEAASILYGGGFPRENSDIARKAAQRGIVAVQRELERMTRELERAALVLCDRGIVDGSVYWPGTRASFYAEIGMTEQEALARYDAVVHLRTPAAADGYDHRNPLRIESAQEAVRLDEAILEAWSGHPQRRVVDASHDFLEKVSEAVALVRAALPECCRPPRGP